MTSKTAIPTSPHHVGIILDGNRRWAIQKGKSIADGYKAGINAIKNLLPTWKKSNVSILSLFIFSNENHKRSQKEIQILFSLLQSFFEHYLSNIQQLKNENIKIIHTGTFENIPLSTQKKFTELIAITKNHSGSILNLAFNYGGRQEIILGAHNMTKDNLKHIPSENEFKRYLFHPDLPDLDLIIRSGGEQRLSNFFLWQAAYSELYFLNKYWPDFSTCDWHNALLEYKRRNRRFGGNTINDT